jgi:hypothetical protein
VAPGKYVVPFCLGAKEMADPAMAQKFQAGPVGIMLLQAPGAPNMGKTLGQWFVFALLAALAARTSRRARSRRAPATGRCSAWSAGSRS